MRLPWVSRKHHERVRLDFATALGHAYEQHNSTKRDLAIAEDALEAERQWRLTSLPALLAAEERANAAETRALQAEAEVARISNLYHFGPKAFPELWPVARSTWAEMAITHNDGTERP